MVLTFSHFMSREEFLQLDPYIELYLDLYINLLSLVFYISTIERRRLDPYVVIYNIN